MKLVISLSDAKEWQTFERKIDFTATDVQNLSDIIRTETTKLMKDVERYYANKALSAGVVGISSPPIEEKK